MVNFVDRESNQYANQKGEPFETTSKEMKVFIGIVVLMGYHNLSSVRAHWSTDDDLHVEYVTQIMPVSWFEKLKRFLHFANNEEVPTRDNLNYVRAYKVRHVITHVNKAFQKCKGPEKQQSIDERTVKFKGHNTMRQYIKTKPV